MRTPEERLRDALTASAALVQPAEHPVPLPRPAPHHPTRWLIPIAVAVTVLAVTLAGVFLANRRPSTPAAHPTVTEGPASLVPTMTLAAPYFIATGLNHGPSDILVVDVQTGMTTATLKNPSGGDWDAASTTPDPLTFILAGQGTGADVTLYRLTIDTHGRERAFGPVATLTSGDSDLVALAVSPAGRAAYPIANPGSGAYGPAEIDVQALSGGRQTAVAYKTSVTGRVSDLSWSSDGRYLAFEIEGTNNNTDGVRVLDTHAGHDLIANSRPFPGWNNGYTGPTLSADGNILYVMSGWTVKEFNVRTGKLRRILPMPQSTDTHSSSSVLLARDPTGRQVLAVDRTGRVHVVDLATGGSLPVPMPPGGISLFAW